VFSNYIEWKTKDEILGSHGGEYEDDCLLGCCDVKSPTALMMEAASISETTINFTRLHGATSRRQSSSRQKILK
jgi:hypothetical protein